MSKCGMKAQANMWLRYPTLTNQLDQMKLIARITSATLLAAATAAPQATADINDILGKLANGNHSIDNVKNLVNDVIGGNLEYKDLVGDWKYISPAVTFKSDNIVKKAGGAAASAKIEQELEPYYQKAGLSNMKVTFNADSSFVMSVKSAPLKGSITVGDNGQYVFNFKAFGKIKTGSMTAYATKSGKNVKLTFDVSKLISLIEKISTLSGNSTIKGLSAVLSSYDGVNAGFELQKTQ